MSTAAGVSAAQKPRGAFQRLWRALRQLFHEAIGAIFAVLALGWFSAAFRSYTRDVAHWMIGMAVAVALLFVFFSVTSFRKARRL
jgi:glycerol uptake facilitator-like aquaporin